tara:strand:- start:980 stop:1216 length:237 start_codon:yes stop_codon:yes gene_type:complete
MAVFAVIKLQFDHLPRIKNDDFDAYLKIFRIYENKSQWQISSKIKELKSRADPTRPLGALMSLRTISKLYRVIQASTG